GGAGRARLVGGGGGARGVEERVRALPEDDARSAGGEEHGRRGEGTHGHGAEIERGDAAAMAALVDDQRAELPALVLGDQPRGLVTPHLLVESVDQLLAG